MRAYPMIPKCGLVTPLGICLAPNFWSFYAVSGVPNPLTTFSIYLKTSYPCLFIPGSSHNSGSAISLNEKSYFKFGSILKAFLKRTTPWAVHVGSIALSAENYEVAVSSSY